MKDIQKAINGLEIILSRHENEGLIEDVFSAKTIKTSIKALKKQTLFENEVSNIHEWFVDNKDELLNSAMKVANEEFDTFGVSELGGNELIDEVELGCIVECIVDEIQKGILNVLSTYKDQ